VGRRNDFDVAEASTTAEKGQRHKPSNIDGEGLRGNRVDVVQF